MESRGYMPMEQLMEGAQRAATGAEQARRFVKDAYRIKRVTPGIETKEHCPGEHRQNAGNGRKKQIGRG